MNASEVRQLNYLDTSLIQSLLVSQPTSSHSRGHLVVR